MCIGLHVSTVILTRFESNLIFFNKISKKNTPVPNFMKIRPVGAELCAEEHIVRQK